MGSPSNRNEVEAAVREAVITGRLLSLATARERTIPADLLVELLTTPRASGAAPPRGLRLASADVVGDLDLEAALLLCPLALRQCDFTGPVTLTQAQAPAIHLIDCQLTTLNADQLETRGSLELSHGTVVSELSLLGARIGGRLVLDGATLLTESGVALNAEGLHVEKDMLCRDDFEAHGELCLIGAHIGRSLDLTGATLSDHAGRSLNADGLHVELGMFCRDGFKASGEVRLVGARISRQLNLDGATLLGSATALDLEQSEVGAALLRFAALPKGLVDLTAAQLGGLGDKTYGENEPWPKCRLRGCTYDSLHSKAGVKERLAWIAGSPDGYAPQPYEQLAAVYKRSGNDQAARRVGIEKQRRRRHGAPLPTQAWSWFLGATVGHGYRLWQAGVWLIVLLAAGSILFGEVYEKGTHLEPARAAAQVPPYQPVIYTVDALVPVINLGQRTAWNAHGAAQWTAFALTMIGWLLTTALVAGLALRRQ